MTKQTSESSPTRRVHVSRPDPGPPRARSGRAAGIAVASVRLGVTLATERQESRRATQQRLPLCPGDEHSGAADRAAQLHPLARFTPAASRRAAVSAPSTRLPVLVLSRHAKRSAVSRPWRTSGPPKAGLVPTGVEPPIRQNRVYHRRPLLGESTRAGGRTDRYLHALDPIISKRSVISRASAGVCRNAPSPASTQMRLLPNLRPSGSSADADSQAAEIARMQQPGRRSCLWRGARSRSPVRSDVSSARGTPPR